MCTAATYKTKDFYFGRTLDYDFSYSESVTITPRNYCFKFKNKADIKNHYAIIGMAFVFNDYPLYYDAVNEKGLAIAGLNFVGNAFYNDAVSNMDNITPHEVIPWILGQCSSVDDVKKIIGKINIINDVLDEDLPMAQLHWLIADSAHAIVVEQTKSGLNVYDNNVGVLTNNPPFPMQMFNLNNYMSLSPSDPKNSFSGNVDLKVYSRGMGGLGMPGDLSSQSRFVRAAFVRLNSKSANSELESVSQFFHILGSVEQQRGCCTVDDDKYEITIYTSCCNTNKGVYYYTTYNNHQITAVNMYKEDIDGCKLISYPMLLTENINCLN